MPSAGNVSDGAPGRPLRVLCIDHEGGHGGSSRSLFHLLNAMDRGAVSPEIICRTPGQIEDWYGALGIPIQVIPDLPRMTAAAAGFRNGLYDLRVGAAQLWQGRQLMADLAGRIEGHFDVVHFNHISLFLLARHLRKRVSARFTMHIRTRPPPCRLARWQGRIARRACDDFAYITENEKSHFDALVGAAPGQVIYNPALQPDNFTHPHKAIPRDARLKIASLKGFGLALGHMRLVEIAKALADQGRRNDVLFVMAGNMTLRHGLPGRLGELGTQGGTLADYVNEIGLGNMFLFLGWVPDPEGVLAACDLLAAPGMENNPWGRDIIEAYSAGKPVLAVGTWDRFVRHGVTGVLHATFDAAEFATDIAALAGDKETLKRMGSAGRENILMLCSPASSAAKLLEFWQRPQPQSSHTAHASAQKRAVK